MIVNSEIGLSESDIEDSGVQNFKIHSEYGNGNFDIKFLENLDNESESFLSLRLELVDAFPDAR